MGVGLRIFTLWKPACAFFHYGSLHYGMAAAYDTGFERTTKPLRFSTLWFPSLYVAGSGKDIQLNDDFADNPITSNLILLFTVSLSYYIAVIFHEHVKKNGRLCFLF